MDSKLFYLTRTNEMNDSFTRHYIEWKLPDFFMLLNNQTNREIRTNKLNNEENKEDTINKFQLMIKFLGQENDLIEIYCMSDECVSVEAKCTRYHGRGILVVLSNEKRQLSSNKWHLMAVQFKKNLAGENYSLISPMILRFEFFIRHNENIKKDHLTTTYVIDDNHLDISTSTLIGDVTSLLMNTTFSDVTLKSVEGDEFPAHKNILGSRSDVFKAHFIHNTVENATNVVEFPFQTDVLKDVLSYIYTDDAPNINKLSGKLLEAAEFYHLNGLKKLSLEILGNKLTVENAIEALELANLYGVKSLKKKTLEFIKTGATREITATERWQKLQSTEALLVKGVYEFVVNDKLT